MTIQLVYSGIHIIKASVKKDPWIINYMRRLNELPIKFSLSSMTGRMRVLSSPITIENARGSLPRLRVKI